VSQVLFLRDVFKVLGGVVALVSIDVIHLRSKRLLADKSLCHEVVNANPAAPTPDADYWIATAIHVLLENSFDGLLDSYAAFVADKAPRVAR